MSISIEICQHRTGGIITLYCNNSGIFEFRPEGEVTRCHKHGVRFQKYTPSVWFVFRHQCRLNYPAIKADIRQILRPIAASPRDPVTNDNARTASREVPAARRAGSRGRQSRNSRERCFQTMCYVVSRAGCTPLNRVLSQHCQGLDARLHHSLHYAAITLQLVLYSSSQQQLVLCVLIH